MTQVFVNSTFIEEFQGKLQRLADDIMALHDTLERQLGTLHDAWDDPKYQEFIEILEKDKRRIVEISERFTEEATVYLQRKYEDAVRIENVRG